VPAYFFDSSALVKFYVNEIGTVWAEKHEREVQYFKRH